MSPDSCLRSLAKSLERPSPEQETWTRTPKPKFQVLTPAASGEGEEHCESNLPPLIKMNFSRTTNYPATSFVSVCSVSQSMHTLIRNIIVKYSRC